MADDPSSGRRRQDNELVLPEGEFAYIQDTTKGVTMVRTGPAVINLQGQDLPVNYNPATRRFNMVPLAQAAQLNVVVPKGHYCVLQNPAAGTQKHPVAGSPQPAVDLQIGRCEHIIGPASFSLWPRQSAEVISGHQLRLNQYLVIRVYDEEAARANWSQAIIERTTGGKVGELPSTDKDKPAKASAEKAAKDSAEASSEITQTTPEDLSVGRMLIVRGTDVSFYVPPTGIEVVKDEDGKYVREALTLEQLQYCILLDENGKKQYVRGPNVVFPLPTQTFFSNGETRRFRPVELNGGIQGIHIKVIAAYKDVTGDHGKKGAEYKEGDELFITGDTTPIYFPCEQHSVVKYDGRSKHFATAIPAGDGRYTLDRNNGTIEMKTGGEKGAMVLPDPRTHVFVRRVLTASECALMYPGNAEVLAYNGALAEIQRQAPSTRKGVVSEGEVLRSANRGRGQVIGAASKGAGITYSNAGEPDLSSVGAYMSSVGAATFADVSNSGSQTGAEMGGDEFSRNATYTEPRQVTLGSDKYAGVPKLDLWTGYAVMVKDTAGNRRVEIGPKRVLLNFNETVEALTLSTGRPKTTDNLLRTAYLQVSDNKVSDVVNVDTADQVRVSVKFALRVNFESREDKDNTHWFSVANYVKLLCDHVRSMLKAAVRSVTVENFFAKPEEFVRDAILGKKTDGKERQGLRFSENGMYVHDVEVLGVDIADKRIQEMLASAQHQVVETNIQLASERRQLDVTKQQQDIARETQNAHATTREHEAKLKAEQIVRDLTIALASVDSQIKKAGEDLKAKQAAEAISDLIHTSNLARDKANRDAQLAYQSAEQELRIAYLERETKAAIVRLQAVQPGFIEALTVLGDKNAAIQIAQALSVNQILDSKNTEAFVRMFESTKFKSLFEKIAEGALVKQ